MDELSYRAVFDIKWFWPQTLQSFEWANQWAFMGILLVPLLFVLRLVLAYGFQQKLDVAWTRDGLPTDPIALLRFVPPLVLSLSLALLLTALARPQRSNEEVEQWTEGIDIMLAVDISQSMEIKDLTPNRLEAAKDVTRDFIKGRLQDRIGMVIFASEAVSYAPLTLDYEMLNSLVDDIRFEMLRSTGTAIGSALMVCTRAMMDSKSKSKVLILLSDGENTAGNIDPITAAKLAYANNIKIYTIGIGRDGRVEVGTNRFGIPVYQDNTLNETTLREIAKIGEGQYFRATDNQSLQKIFDKIDEFEKSEIKESRFKTVKDYYWVYLIWGILCLLLWLLLKSTFMVNAMED